MLESEYQTKLIRKLKRRFPGCFVLKNDTDFVQGLPDLIILYGPCWAMLEVKLNPKYSEQPNQSYYINMFNEMSFAAFIYPGNEEEVLDALQHAFKSFGDSRLS